MTPPEPTSNGYVGGAGPILAVSAIVFVVALAAFQAISAGLPGSEVGDAGTGEDRWPDEMSPGTFSDPDLGLAITVPAAWERTFEPVSTGASARVTFRDPATAARLELEAWDAVGLAPFPLWLGVVAGGMEAVNEDPLPNATLAGTPAWVLGKAATVDAPAAYAAFLERDGRYYRITYHDQAGSGPQDFRRVLASIAWPGGSGTISVPKILEGVGPAR